MTLTPEEAHTLSELLVIGCQMSNICFNVQQKRSVSDHDAQCIERVRARWDAIPKGRIIRKLDDWWPGFDPIALGS